MEKPTLGLNDCLDVTGGEGASDTINCYIDVPESPTDTPTPPPLPLPLPTVVILDPADGFAMAFAPAIVTFVSGRPKDAINATLEMYEITYAEHKYFTMPLAYGRFHFGEKLQFLYYARGSLFETKFWLNRARKRSLMPPAQVEDYASQLTDLARQLNAFATTLKAQRKTSRSKPKAIGEATVEYATDVAHEAPVPLFTKEDLQWLQTINT